MSSTKQKSPELPEIRIEDGELKPLIDASIAALAAKNLVYVYAEKLAVIHVTLLEEEGTIHRPAGAARIHFVDGVFLTELLDSAARFIKYDRRIGEYRVINAPRRLGDHILARGAWPEFRRLDGILECPTIWRGELIDRPGYHLASRLYLTKIPAGYKTPPAHPLLRDAEAALDRLRDSISTFPFESTADESASLAMIITAVVRRILPCAPALCITANTPGSGKSLMARIVSEIAIGRQGSLLALTGDEAEDEKRLAAGLLAGDAILNADNVEEVIGGAMLCSMLTEPQVSVRMLGASVLVPVPTNVCLMINGNNLALVRDLRRRVLLVRLNAGVEHPEERVFGRNAVSYVRERRGSLIRDVLTIVMAYQLAAEPNVGLLPFGGFEDWDRIVRRPLVWLGMPDPLAPAAGLRELDPDLEATRALFQSWFDVFGHHGATCAEAIAAARKNAQRFDDQIEPSHPELREALAMASSDKLDSRRLAAWLRRHRERIVDGLTLRQGTDGHAKVARWSVVECGVRRS